jgi:hypothetical protein
LPFSVLPLRLLTSLDGHDRMFVISAHGNNHQSPIINHQLISNNQTLNSNLVIKILNLFDDWLLIIEYLF